MMMVDMLRTRVEFAPPTRWCSAQAVVYTVGEPLDAPLDIPSNGIWRPALAGMLSPTVLGSLPDEYKARRRRWVAEVCVEEPADLRLPLWQRPAFLRFYSLSRLMVGGGAVDDLTVFGRDPFEQAVALTVLQKRSRRLTNPSLMVLEENKIGTFFVAARALCGRNGMKGLLNDLTHGLAVDRLGRAVQELEEQLEEHSALLEDHVDIVFPPAGVQSARGVDLAYESARTAAAAMRLQGIDVDVATHALNLSGLLNKSNHRNWYPKITAEAGGWER